MSRVRELNSRVLSFSFVCEFEQITNKLLTTNQLLFTSHDSHTMAHETNGEENNAHEFSLDEYNKALDLFSLFSIQSPLPNELSDLNDGVAIFQVLSD